ncbi:hypothetical protein DZA31_00380 [Arcobacter sp. HD9-500m-PIT-SAG02]|nr:hypothetical protein DZA31_00380 [Arcobacter sp. HD9-500m-PIT-SAG02]
MFKILLLEDTAPKLKKLKDAILKNTNIEARNITSTVCSNDARRELYANHFDLFVTDLLVPANFEDDPSAEESISLLHDIANDDLIKKPSYIIGLSAYEGEIFKYEQYFSCEDWNLQHYDESENEWELSINQRIDYIQKSKSTNLQEIEEYKYDIGIICALNNPEFAYIKDLSSNWNEVSKKNSPIQFYETYFIREDKKLKVIAASIDKMGMVATSILATQMIELFRPKYLTMTGIAAGIKGEVELGDLLVFEYSWDYNSGKIKSDDENNELFEVDIRQESLCSDLCNYMKTLKNDEDFLFNVYKKYNDFKPKTHLNIHIGHVASGAAVIAHDVITSNIQKQSRKLKGIEMEGYAIFCAANNATNPKPIPLVMKSVCDFADKEKSDNIQNYAAYTSAEVLHEFFLRYVESIN